MSFVHLHCHSNYSFLDGAATIEALVEATLAKGMSALALTDANGLYGAVRFSKEARERGLKPILGCELKLVDHGIPLVLLARNREGWTNLCRIVSASQLAGQKGAPRATLDIVGRNPQQLFALCATEDRALLIRLREIFGESLFVELIDHWEPDDAERCDRLALLAKELEIGTVVTNDVRYANPEGRRLHDVLRCIDLGTTLDAAGKQLPANGERWLKPEDVLRARLGRFPDAFTNVAEIAERCDVDIAFGYQRLPGYPPPDGSTPTEYLRRLCEEGLRTRYGPVVGADPTKRLEHELRVIERCGLPEFFLINHDIARFCKERGIPAQGRGSAADSIVAYVLGITKVDPIRHNLLFERFLIEEKATMPDIDIDIGTKDREEVLQYVYDKYGQDHAAMVCNVVTYRSRSAVREVAKVLGFRQEPVERMAKEIELSDSELTDLERERLPLFRELVAAIADFPRHLSIHSGGMLITALPLVDTVPIERARMPDRNVVQFDKRDVEDLGLIKMDLLGLRTLSLVKDSLGLIERWHGVRLDLDSLDLENPAIYELLQEVDTIGVFQVESRAQAQALPRVKPACFDDIVIQVAIIRPGPLQGNMVNPYIRRRQGREVPTYDHPDLIPVLGETLGVILFQEQVLKVAMAVAGFTPLEADGLRRAISRARSVRDMEKEKPKFLAGAAKKGLNEEVAGRIFDQIKGFAEFGFCKSHAAAFGLTAYQTAHLKVYYPAEFYVALLNNQPMGFYSPAVIAGDAKRHGVRILPVDLNISGPTAAIEEGDASPEYPDISRTISRHRICHHHVRLGFSSVSGLGDTEALAIVAEREQGGSFESFDDVAGRVALSETALRKLALVGAFDALGEPRRELLWRAAEAHRTSPGFLRRSLPFPSLPAPRLPTLNEQERTALDYRVTGIPVGPHVMRYYRGALEKAGVLTSLGLTHAAHDSDVRVAGALVVKQHPGTAKGHVFLSLEDETGLANVILRPAIYRQFKEAIDTSAALVVAGALQHVDGVVSVLARRVDPLGLFVPIKTHSWH